MTLQVHALTMRWSLPRYNVNKVISGRGCCFFTWLNQIAINCDSVPTKPFARDQQYGLTSHGGVNLIDTKAINDFGILAASATANSRILSLDPPGPKKVQKSTFFGGKECRRSLI
jgi:hypothetical protein